jgi:antirestriction protein
MERTEYEKLINRIKELLSLDENKTMFDGEHNYERVIAIYCENHHITKPTIETLEEVEEAYCGEWNSMKDYAMHIVEECGMLDQMPDNLRHYFDYEAYGRDLVYSGDYWFHEDGYVFRSL